MPQNAEGEDIEPTKNTQEQGLFAGMSIFRKILLFIVGLIIFLLAWNFIFGGITNVWEALFAVALFIAMLACAYVILKAINIVVQKGYYSPKEDYFTRITNLAVDLRPGNVRDLYFMGSKDKQRVKGGKIIGVLGIPYLIGDPEIENGRLKMVKNEKLDQDFPAFKKIWWGKDGDTLIIYEKGFLLPKRHFLRCNWKLHSELHGDVTVFDINPVPYEQFEFPFKQMQKDPARIMIQSQMEIILATHSHQHDLISQGVDSAIYFNPYVRMIQKQQAELSAD